TDIPAAVHPADETVRPQVVTKEANPRYYSLIKAFKKKTGVGCLLNTSFNLHGYPIVNTPEHAFFVFENSGIDVLVLNNTLIAKNNLTKPTHVGTDVRVLENNNITYTSTSKSV
ncbi:MAG: hypothetical protein HRT90_01440, partial [Candidatus Margulisbacteria bacterium]|nr:hypothetical protein [Candidatus Margulisiibacteriota bacterium]